MIDAANQINDTPYIWGGGHGSFQDDGYDCSGSVSYALHGGGLLSSPLDSGGLTAWGSPGPRMCPQGTVFVYTCRASMRTCGMRYSPAASPAPGRLANGIGLKAPYAPLL